MKIAKYLVFVLWLASLVGVAGCVVVDGAGERSWTLGAKENPIASYRLTATEGDLNTNANLDPSAVVDYAVATGKRWIGLFKP